MAKTGLMGKKIPTILGLFILIGGLIAGIILVNMRQIVESKAGPTESPKNIKISNKTATTFSISWTTDIPLTGYVRYSENPAKITMPAGDVRDQISGSSQSYTNHHVNVSGLGANKTYYFLIGSGSKTYDDGGKPFQIRTGPQVVAPAEDVVYGKIIGSTGNPVNGAIVFVEPEGGETLSAITKTDGAWRLNIANSRDKEGKVLTYDPVKTLLSIFVQAGSAGTATAITDMSKAKPVADIELGKNQSFVEGILAPTINLAASESATASPALTAATGSAEIMQTTDEITEIADPQIGGFNIEQSTPVQQEASVAAKIANPAINGEIIATSSPEFKGNATPGTTVKISVHSNEELTAVVKVGADGTWSWTPPQPLSAGDHVLTVEYTDGNNTVQKMTRTFTILASAVEVANVSLPAFTATPSATPTASPSATPEPTPTEIEIMPATDSAELVDSGTLSTTLMLVLFGAALVWFGKFSKKWTD